MIVGVDVDSDCWAFATPPPPDAANREANATSNVDNDFIFDGYFDLTSLLISGKNRCTYVLCPWMHSQMIVCLK